MNRKKPQEILGAFLIQSIQKTRAWSDGAGHWVSKFALSWNDHRWLGGDHTI